MSSALVTLSYYVIFLTQLSLLEHVCWLLGTKAASFPESIWKMVIIACVILFFSFSTIYPVSKRRPFPWFM